MLVLYCIILVSISSVYLTFHRCFPSVGVAIIYSKYLHLSPPPNIYQFPKSNLFTAHSPSIYVYTGKRKHQAIVNNLEVGAPAQTTTHTHIYTGYLLFPSHPIPFRFNLFDLTTEIQQGKKRLTQHNNSSQPSCQTPR